MLKMKILQQLKNPIRSMLKFHKIYRTMPNAVLNESFEYDETDAMKKQAQAAEHIAVSIICGVII
jgi:hypothetical protein